MDKQEFINRLSEIKQRFQKEVDELGKQYAREHNPYKVGDIISDHIGAMQIERVQVVLGAYVSVSFNEPYCRYYGIQLKKDGTPLKTSRPNTRNIPTKHKKQIIC